MTPPTVSVQDLLIRGEAELTTGPFGTQLKAGEYVESGTPVINVRNIGFGDIREADLEFLGPETANRLSRHALLPSDIVFGRKGAVERHAFIQKRHAGWIQGSDCLRLRILTTRFEPRFVSYFLLTEQHKQWMQNQCSHGATMASLNQRILSRIELPAFDVPTQRKIASILSAYDDLIDNNTRRIKLLKEMAQRIYREWFVDLRYPGHEDVPLVESELGPIPKGWVATTTAELIEQGVLEIGDGYRAKHSEFGDEGLPFVRIRDLNEDFDFSGVDLLPREALPAIGSKVSQAGDCVISTKGTVGRVLYISRMTPTFVYSPQLSYWRSLAPRIAPVYLRAWLAGPDFERQCAGVKGGTDMADYVNLKDQRRMSIVVPPPAVQQRLSDTLEPLVDLGERLRFARRSLRRSRDLVLPRLVAGEIAVENLDIQIPDAA